MIQYKNQYAQKIYDVINPVLGDMIAKGSLRAHCSKLGITEETIQLKDLPALSERLRKGLVLFLGTENALAIASKIMKI